MTINVFIVDDSATARTALSLILEASDEVNVLGFASNPRIALKRMDKLWPDVIISDLEMPEMNGFEFLQFLNRHHPTPFVVFSNYTQSSAAASVEALSQGAVDIISKPNFSRDNLDDTREEVLNAIKAAADLGRKLKLKKIPTLEATPDANAETELSDQYKKRHLSMQLDLNVKIPKIKRQQYAMIAIGSSTGGTIVIEKILRQLPANCPGIVIVQHMPERFTAAYANRINALCQIKVKEAEPGDQIKPGLALIAPGGKHMRVVCKKGVYSISLFDGDSVNRHKPSVDVLFHSIAEFGKGDSLGILLTGMGKDGAKGLLAMHKSGAMTIAQAEEDSAIYGMPKAAMAIGAANHQLNSSQIAKLMSTIKPLTP
ncbi:MAG: chemotaxis response regulator protein-glutamate methylesterase [Pseudomonadales bacterium]|nr:chemotaxis response regulator protein-glutamate methylesterase [Pseudomonadales bacterium]